MPEVKRSPTVMARKFLLALGCRSLLLRRSWNATCRLRSGSAFAQCSEKSSKYRDRWMGWGVGSIPESQSFAWIRRDGTCRRSNV